MGRIASLGVVAGVAVLAVAALVDAIVGGAPRPPAATTTTTADRAPRAFAGALREAGVSGRLLFTDPDDCSLHALRLPAVAPDEAPVWDTCAFAVGPGSTIAPEGTVFDRFGRLRAAEFNGAVEVVDPAGQGVRLQARAPAFRPDGTLTVVRRGALVVLPPCPGPGPEVLRIGGCRSTVVTERRLTALARLAVDPRPLRLAIVAAAWLDDVHVAVLVQAGDAEALLGIATGGRVPTVDVWFEDDSLRELMATPRHGWVSVVTSTGELAVFDRRGVLLGLRGSRVRAASWSRDGRWLALLDGDGVLFVDTTDGATVGPVPLAARDLAWG